MTSARCVPNTCSAKADQRGSPVGMPGSAVQTPRARPAHFSQGARRSRGERAGNSKENVEHRREQPEEDGAKREDKAAQYQRRGSVRVAKTGGCDETGEHQRKQPGVAVVRTQEKDGEADYQKKHRERAHGLMGRAAGQTLRGAGLDGRAKDSVQAEQTGLAGPLDQESARYVLWQPGVGDCLRPPGGYG
jgi:hypothetical protein